jgi:hypothetical protein
MRRFIPAGFVAVVALAAFAAPASASFDSHFGVRSIQTSSANSANSFVFTEVLVAEYNHHLIVGHDKGKCSFDSQHNKVDCKVIVKLNGLVGGHGTLKVRGDLERRDNKLYVSGGTHAFNGVGGKVLVHGRHLHFDLVS